MKNIFENAKLGDQFKTREGHKVVYWYYNADDEYHMPHWVIFDNGSITHYRDDGFYNNPYNGKESDLDIVDRWEEPFDMLNVVQTKLAESVDEYFNYVSHQQDIHPYSKEKEQELYNNICWRWQDWTDVKYDKPDTWELNFNDYDI